MSYFRELPNLDYQSPLSDKNSSLDYVRVKNLFRRVKLRDDLQNVFTIFNKYIVKDGARPDTVAEELYGASDLDWVVLITAGIV
ncbi:MAG: baseplate wedge protein 53, partial [Candidatus Nanopelagicales bacterium]